VRLHALGIGTALAVGAGMVIASAQTASPTVDGLVSAAKVAAGTDWSGTFMRLCIPPPPAPAAARGGANTARTSTPSRETWHVEPAKVADNLYFLGEKAHHSFAIVGSDGIILIEALYDYMVADEVAGGMRKLGFRPYVSPEHQSHIITTFHYPEADFDFRSFYNRLHERGYIIYPGKLTTVNTFRIANIGSIGRREIESLLGAIAEVRGGPR